MADKIILMPPKTRDKTTYKTITPEKFRQAFEAAQNGRPAALYKIIDWFVSMDGHLSGAMQSRISAQISSAETNFVMGKPSKTEDAALENLKEALNKTGIRDLRKELLKCKLYGARAVEMVWDTVVLNGKSLVAPVGFRRLPHDFIYAKKQNRTDAYNTLFVGNDPLDVYDAGHVVFALDGAKEEFTDWDFTGFGKGISAMRYSIIKFFDVDDWAAFNEVFGMPLRLGILKPGHDDNAVKRLEDAVHNLGSDASAVIDDTTEIKFPEAQKYGSTNAYETLSEFCNREISKAITSESLTGSSGKTGTYGAMKTANGIRLDVAQGDALDVDAILQKNIIDVFYALNYGALDVPRIQTHIKPAVDLNKQAQVDKALFEMGLELSVSGLRKRYDAPAPIDDADILKKTGNGLFG